MADPINPDAGLLRAQARLEQSLAELERALLGLLGAADARQIPVDAELAWLRDALEQLVILAGGSDG